MHELQTKLVRNSEKSITPLKLIVSVFVWDKVSEQGNSIKQNYFNIFYLNVAWK